MKVLASSYLRNAISYNILIGLIHTGIFLRNSMAIKPVMSITAIYDSS
jgi:hypothetical protein